MIMYIGLGNKEQALKSLEAAYAEHSPGLTAIKVGPAYDSLRAEPRFQTVLKGTRLEK